MLAKLINVMHDINKYLVNMFHMAFTHKLIIKLLLIIVTINFWYNTKFV